MADRMRVVEISEPGGPEVLKPATREVPGPGHGDVLIRVAFAGVNRPDALQRAGSYAPPKGASDLPGLEAAGEIAAIGPGVTDWAVGDEVCALLPGGGYAEFVVTPAAHCLPVPKGMGLKEAACLPETYFTVWSNVFERGGLQAGERFLVHGALPGLAPRRSNWPMSGVHGCSPPPGRPKNAPFVKSSALNGRSITGTRILSRS